MLWAWLVMLWACLSYPQNIDLYALTGWIPERIELKDRKDSELDAVFRQIEHTHKRGTSDPVDHYSALEELVSTLLLNTMHICRECFNHGCHGRPECCGQREKWTGSFACIRIA